MKVYGYIKGPATLRKQILKWGTDNRTEIEQVLEDEEGKNSGIMELLALMESGDKLVCLDPGQLWDNPKTEAIVRRELNKIQATCIFLNGEEPGPSEQVNLIMEALADYERTGSVLQMNRGRIRKARGGNRPAGALPYGYKFDGKYAVVVPEEAEVIKAMFTEAQKGLTLRQIAEEMNHRGYVTRRGLKWQSGQVQIILRNRFYIGEMLWKDEVIQGKHEPIISKIQFGKVGAQLTRRHR